MKVRVARITIGGYTFEYMTSIQITESWKNLTDTCTIELPRRFNTVLNNNQAVTLDKALKAGDKVTVELGYDFRFQTRFKGYLKSIKPNYPIEITVEDEMYKWKRTKVSPKAFRGGSIAQIFQYLGIDNYKILGDGSMTIGDYFIDQEQNTVAKVLEKLKEVTKFPIFMRKGVLHIGDKYDPNPKNRTRHIYTVGKNIIEHDLEYRMKEDNPMQVTVISTLSNGKVNKVTIGDDGKDVSKIEFKAPTNIKDDNLLKKIGLQELNKKNYTGWRGKLKVFGEPIVSHGDIVELDDIDHGLIKGSYFVDQVDISASISEAYIQEIELGQIVI